MTRRYQHSPQYLRAHAKRVERKRAAREAKAQQPKTYYVYVIRNIHSKAVYYGCTSNIKQRIGYMFRGAPDSAIAKAIREQGESAFTREILMETTEKLRASQYEGDLIDSIMKQFKHLAYNSAVNVPYARNSSTPRPRQICICPECGASHTRKKGFNVE